MFSGQLAVHRILPAGHSESIAEMKRVRAKDFFVKGVEGVAFELIFVWQYMSSLIIIRLRNQCYGYRDGMELAQAR